ncbi:MAG: SpoIIE family protein phosphatase [Verrucomicrobiae bacterium]|nr:SpoIIE family protein phosphatase [Verrucomicrobiae bacterium]
MAVKAFDANETREMVSRVLLETPDRVDGLARYLLARTQGNPFFILELLRTLIDERVVRYEDGRCRFEQAELERVDLPDNLVDAVLRRVRDLPPSDLEVLSLAAVVGKEVQLELLSSLTTRRIEDLVGTIDRAVDHQILARDIAEEDSVAFVHDRVREAFYGRVDNVSELHGRIARELESRNPEGGGRVVYDLAYHYGRGEQSEKALDYSLKAAAMAAQSTAHDLAVHLYGQARGLLESKSQTDDPRYLDALEGLGEASRLSGKFTEAIDVLKICVRLVPKQDRLRLTRVLAKLADAHFERAEAVMATKLIERALRGVGIHLPKSRLAMRCGILWEFLVQMIHTARPRRRAKPGAPPSALEEITTRLLSRLTYISYFHDSEKTFYVYLRNLNRCENLPPSTMLAAQYALAGPIWSSIPWFWKARRDLNLGIEMSKAFNDRHQEACSYSYFISVCHLMNEPALGIEYSSKAIGILRRIGEYYDLGVAYVFREHCNSVYTRYSKAVADNEEFLRVIRDCGVPQPLTWALTYKSYHHSIAGTLTPEGLVEMQKSVDDNEAMGDKPSSIAGYGHLAFAYSRMGQLDRALSVVGHIEELMRAYDMRAPWILELWPICAEIHMEVYLRDRASDPAKAADHLERARRYCDEARRAGGKFRYVYGWAWQVSGTYWWITGRKSRALRAWDRGIRYVRHHPCDFRLGCLLREAARWIRTEDPKSRLAQEYLLEAKEAFEAADCLKDAEEVAALLHGAKQREVHRTRQALTFKRHLESLLSVTQAIGSVFDLKELLQQILSYAMEVSGSERGCILLRAEASSALELRVGSGWSREVAAKPFSYESYGVSLALIERVRQKGEALVAGAKDGGEAAEELAASGVRQAMAVPLRTKEKDLGFLYLDNQMADGVFGEEELELMKSFAIQAAVSIENTSLVQSLVEQDRLKQEMQLGQEIQQGFLPKEAPVVTGLKVAAFMQPAREIGGDYYDFILRPGNNGSSPLAVVIGDVTGKGLGAGLNMAMVKTTLLTLSREEIGLGEILTKANRILHGQMTFGTFISLLYLQWNPAMRALSFAAAGHCDPLVLRAATSKVERIPSGGIALGLIPEIESKIQERALPLAPGDHVLLFTDGVIEAQNARGEEFGMERLTEAVQRHGPRGAAGLAAGLREDVAAFIGSEAQYDDITLIVLEVDR